MHTTLSRPVVRRLLGALPLALLLCVACDGASPNTIGGYCRRDTDCVSGLRCLDHLCTERRAVDAGTPPVDLGGTSDSGPVDVGQVDSGPVSDMGRDLGLVDMGRDLGPEDMGVDSGPEDMGTDSGPVDSGP